MKNLRSLLSLSTVFTGVVVCLPVATPAIEPASFDLEALYPRIVPFPSTVPPECRGDGEVNAGRLIAFEERFAALLEEHYGPITSPGLRSSLNELDDRAHGLAFRFTMENSVTVSEEDIRRTYEEFQDRFRVSGRATVDFFFVEQPEGEEEAAPEVLERLRELGVEGATVDQLRDLAEEEGGVIYSDRSARIEPSGVAELIWETVSATPAGEFSPVTRTNHGWHFFLVHDKRSPGIRPLEEVESTVRGHLLQERALAIRDEVRAEFPDTTDFFRDDDYAPLERRYIRDLYGDRIDEIETLRDVMVNNALVLAYEGVVREGIELTEDLRRGEFDENRETYLTPIIEDVIEVRVAFPENEEQAAAIEEWNDQVRSGAHTFPGGDLLEELGLSHQIIDHGPSRRGPRGARLDLTVRDMEVNSLSEAVEGSGYYRFFYLRGREDRQPMSFEEAREDIDRRLVGRLLQKRLAELACEAWEYVAGR